MSIQKKKKKSYQNFSDKNWYWILKNMKNWEWEAQWPTPGLGTDRRIRSMLARCLWKSCSLFRVAWPFLLGEEDGTVPLGRAWNRDESTAVSFLTSSYSVLVIRSFLPSMFDRNAGKITKKMREKAVERAIDVAERLKIEKMVSGFRPWRLAEGEKVM